jgi:type II secretory pathway pseudopilin PulG
MKLSQSLEAQKLQQSGFILATLMAFIPLLAILATIAISVGLQANQTAVLQQYKEQAQLASTTAIDFAKEQYEIDADYRETPETDLYITGQYRVTYEVVHDGYSNALQTQQDIRGIGRVYKLGDTTPRVSREIQGKITYTAGTPSSVRFIFIIDNSGSMDESEWLDSKSTVDIAIEYVLENVSTAEVGVIQYGTAGYDGSYNEHKYDVTVPFTSDLVTATTWDRRYGNGSTAYWDRQDHLPGSLARMRQESVYSPGRELDLNGATDIQYVLFTDARGTGFASPYQSYCCSSLKRLSTDPIDWHDDNGVGFFIEDSYGEYNAIKDGTVFAEDGYPGLTSQFSVLSIDTSDPTSPGISAAIASPGGNWTGDIDSNAGDPEVNGLLPRRFISTSLAAGADEIIELLAEVIDDEINF